MKIGAILSLLLSLLLIECFRVGGVGPQEQIHQVHSTAIAGRPTALAYDSQNDRLLVTATDAGSLVAIDRSSRTVVASIGVGDHPTSALLLPNQDTLYSLNSGDRSISVINRIALSLVQSIDLRQYVHSISDAPKLLVGSTDEDLLYVVSTSENSSYTFSSIVSVDIKNRIVRDVVPLLGDSLLSRTVFGFSPSVVDGIGSIILYGQRDSRRGILFRSSLLSPDSTHGISLDYVGCALIHPKTASVYAFVHDHLVVMPLERFFRENEDSLVARIDVGQSAHSRFGGMCSLSFDGVSRLYVVDPSQRYLTVVDTLRGVALASMDLDDVPADVEAFGASGEFAVSFPDIGAVRLYQILS